MKRTFIENIWCFSKDPTIELIPKPTTLDAFWN